MLICLTYFSVPLNGLLLQLTALHIYLQNKYKEINNLVNTQKFHICVGWQICCLILLMITKNESSIVVRCDEICADTSAVCWRVIVCLVSVSSHWRRVVCGDHVWLSDAAPVPPRHTQTIAAGINSISASHNGKMSESHWANLQPCTCTEATLPHGFCGQILGICRNVSASTLVSGAGVVGRQREYCWRLEWAWHWAVDVGKLIFLVGYYLFIIHQHVPTYLTVELDRNLYLLYAFEEG